MSFRLTALALAISLAAAAQTVAPPASPPPAAPPGTAPAAAAAAAPQPDVPELHFTGEVLRDKIYDHDIGHGLIFRLYSRHIGRRRWWVIEILPTRQAADDPVEFSEIATPPYRAYNERYVAAAFGYSAKEALDTPLRKFQFVQSLADEHIASEVVNAMLYPSIVGDEEKQRISSEAAGVFLGAGQFRIVASRINPGKGTPDTIAWIKFEVVLNFASDFTLQQALAPQAAPPPPRHRH